MSEQTTTHKVGDKVIIMVGGYQWTPARIVDIRPDGRYTLYTATLVTLHGYTANQLKAVSK